MSKFDALRAQFQKAIQRLEEVLKQEKNEFVRDSAIIRFEFSFDLSWKLIKAFLNEVHGVHCHSPKSCFREAFQQGVIDYEDCWLMMTDLRNKIAHTYKEETAEDVYAQLAQVLSKFKELLKFFEDGGKT